MDRNSTQFKETLQGLLRDIALQAKQAEPEGGSDQSGDFNKEAWMLNKIVSASGMGMDVAELLEVTDHFLNPGSGVNEIDHTKSKYKVFAINEDGRHEIMVAAKSLKQALVLLKVSQHSYYNHKFDFDNNSEAGRIAISQPGVVFRKKMNQPDSCWVVSSLIID